MKKIYIGTLTLFMMSMITISYPSGKIQKDDCMFNSKKLFGKVQIVDSFPDFKVKVTAGFPDLKVKMVTSFPDECGEWLMVESFPDFKIQIVDSFEDFSIKYVDSFPGVD